LPCALARTEGETVPLDACTIDHAASSAAAPDHATPLRIGLLGLGQVGTAVTTHARAAARPGGRALTVASALVRDPASRVRPEGVPLVTRVDDVFARQPDVVVEVLGGIEPARSFILEAIARRIPVVTANKSLLAHCGDELFEAARTARVPLLCEASVIAGLPFLAPVARRPAFRSSLVSVTGIVNGTTNFVLSRMAVSGADYDTALDEARRRGFAEPDPTNDVQGIDALEKLVVLLRHLVQVSVDPRAIEVDGIGAVTCDDLRRARELGGTIKPVVHAAWVEGRLEAFAGPAFVPLDNPLARLDGVANGIVLRDRWGQSLIFAGPGAGPDVTAATILDDVVEAVEGTGGDPAEAERHVGGCLKRQRVTSPATAWLLNLVGACPMPTGPEIADLLASYGVWIERTARESRDGSGAVSLLTYACSRDRIQAAALALESAARCRATARRALGGDA
jgi:homoserine dehydrogenase